MEFLSVMLKDGVLTAVVTGEKNAQVEFEHEDFESGILEAVKQLFAVNELKVGDDVNLKGKGVCYSEYLNWFDENDCCDLKSHYVRGQAPVPFKTYKLVAVGPHEDEKHGTVYAIQDYQTTQVFLMCEGNIYKS